MATDEERYPIVPHELAGGGECCGCLVVSLRGTEADLKCNECGATVCTVPSADAARVVMEMLLTEICSARCPHCGILNTFPGFSVMETFVCSECGQDVALPMAVEQSAG